MTETRTPSSDTIKMPRESLAEALARDAEHADELRCPACAPTWDKPCGCCRNTRFVSRAVFAAFHARGDGRPSETRLDSYDQGKG